MKFIAVMKIIWREGSRRNEVHRRYEDHLRGTSTRKEVHPLYSPQTQATPQNPTPISTKIPLYRYLSLLNLLRIVYTEE